MSGLSEYEDPEDGDPENCDLPAGELQQSDADIAAATFDLQAKAMLEEGLSPFSILTGLQAIAAEMSWEIYERISE